MRNAIGILFANNSADILQGLAFERSIAAVPFGGRYRLLDFALSSMVNTGIRTIGLVTPRHYRSLLDHLGAGKEWFLDRKTGGLFILPGAIQGLSAQGGKFRLKDLHLNIEYLQKDFCENVIISGCNHVVNINYQAALHLHASKQADITLIYKESMDSAAMVGKELLSIGEDQEILSIQGNDITESTGLVQAYFADMLIIRRKLLLKIVEGYRSIETVDLMETIQENLPSLKIYGVPFKGYFGTVNSVKEYFSRSMELLNPEIRKEVLTSQDQIHTKIVDNPPTKHGAHAKVSNSLISSGCTIEGEVHNSILSRGVIVESGAVIRNSVVMQKCRIAADASLNYVILDKFVKVHAGNVLKGNENKPLVVLKGSLV